MGEALLTKVLTADVLGLQCNNASSYLWRVKHLLLLLFLMLPLALLAQEDDYYGPQSKQPMVTMEQVKNMTRWGPKLGIELHAALSYNHLRLPMSIANGFKSSGGAGMDAGGGIRVRLYHKLAMAAGFNFAIRQYSLSYEAQDVDTINPQLYAVDEGATLYLMGFYQKTIMELTRKISLALAFQYTWINKYEGHVVVDNLTTPGSSPAPFDIDAPLLEGWSKTESQAELGIEFAYKIHIANELIIKPYFGAGYVFSPAVNTGIMLQTPNIFGQSTLTEQNPNFLNLRIGVIIETGLWLDKVKREE